jgi:REP element-mobilizing transposase RayT
MDDRDRSDLLRRVDWLFTQLGFACFAWVFMSNHVHFVLQTGEFPLPRLMARLGTGYALYFNRRHGRKGHLWQDRYWSRPLEEDVETAAAYVHANPIRAGLTEEERPAAYYWWGHAGVVGARPRLPFETQAARIPMAVQAASRLEPNPPREPLEALIARVCVRAGVSAAEVRAARRPREVTRARAEIAALAVRDAGYRAAEVARALGLDESSVSRLLRRVPH